MRNTRKVVTSGLVALLATATLAACGDAPEEETGSNGERRARPRATSCPASSPTRAASTTSRSTSSASRAPSRPPTSSASSSSTSSPTARTTTRPNLESLVAEGCDAIVTVGFALSAATVESATANPDIDYVLIDDAADNDFDGDPKDADEHQAAPLQHRRGGVPRRLRRRRLHQDRQRRHLRRPAVPDRDDLHGRLQAGRRVLRRGEGQGRQGRRLRAARRAPSPVASRPTRRPPTPRAASSTRAPT